MSSTGWVQKQTAPIVNMNWEDGPAGRIYEQVWMGGRECAHRSETVVVPAPQLLLLLLLHSPLLLSPPPPVAPTTPRPVAFFPVTFFRSDLFPSSFAICILQHYLWWQIVILVGISTFLKVDNIWLWSASNMWLMWQVGMTVTERVRFGKLLTLWQSSVLTCLSKLGMLSTLWKIICWLGNQHLRFYPTQAGLSVQK